MENKKIAVLIPCYNESLTVQKVVSDFRKALPEADIYVYDNNSTDGTDVLAKQAGAVVRHEYKQGKGNVIRAMFRDVEADCYVMADGDDTYPAENAREMCDMILAGKADMVNGDRLSSTYFQENKRLFHNSGNVLVRRLINWLFHSDVRDIMTGYRAFNRRFVKTFPVLSKGFEIETEMTIHALDKNYFIREVPVAYRDRPAGSYSKLDTVSDGVRVLGTIAALFRDYKPMWFFSVFAVLSAAAAVILFIPVFTEYIRTGLVGRFPTLIVAGLLMVVSLLMLVCGAILEVIVKKDRQNYELMVNLICKEERK
ncbi:MAG: glycosyltransferase [Lachnospiraceae bacterium]|nr:glycosyltransferase [Lachnospiraceae bacterium]